MHEILIQYGTFTLTTFDAFLVLALIFGTIFLVRYVQFKNMSLRFFVNNLFWFVLVALIGGRLVYLAEHFSVYWGNLLSIVYLWDMGYSPLGVFYAVILLLLWSVRRDHEDFWAWLDVFALTGLVGLFFIHLGRFFDGADYGMPTDLPWGIAFDNFNIPYQTAIHPTQLYSALATFLIFNMTMWSAKRTHLTGMVGTMVIMLYSLCAFGIDFLHGEPSMFAKISFGAIAALAFIFHIHCSHKKLLKPAP
jgi:phosphatidylglycerol---prolipoprotein diacylglyceryl transferase